MNRVTERERQEPCEEESPISQQSQEAEHSQWSADPERESTFKRRQD
jgi:hypothetical protein